MDYKLLKIHYDSILNRQPLESSNDEPTPMDCVEEMINSIPNHFWNKNNLRILDPCCGNGNFHLYINTKIKDINFLFFNDTNSKRLENVKRTFKNCKNIFNEDFLQSKWNLKFDLIVANPPYAKIDINGKRSSKNHNLIKNFLEKSLDYLNNGGFLLFITPDNWMSCSDRNTIVTRLTNLQIHTLNIHTPKRYFKRVGSSFTWYLIENKPFYKDINIQGIWKGTLYNDTVKSCIRTYIPLYYTEVIRNILLKTIDCDNVKFNILTSSNLHKTTKSEFIRNTKDSTYCYKIIHTPKQIVYSSVPHKYQTFYKVFISTTDKYKIFIDNCGMTQSIAFIICKNKSEAEKIKNILEHPLYIFLNNICRWGNFNNIRILQKFPKCIQRDVFSYFKINKKEKELILSSI